MAAALISAALLMAGCGADDDSGAVEDPLPSATPEPDPTLAPTPSGGSEAIAPPAANSDDENEILPVAGPTVAASADIERAPVDPTAPVAELVTGFADAGFDLMRNQPVEDNLVFSPMSIGHALLMAEAAADEATAAAISAAFGTPGGMGGHEAWNALSVAIENANLTSAALDGSISPIATLSDRLWPSTAATPDQAWVDLMATYHGADVELIDTSEPEASRARINQWVSAQTNELIPQLLPAGFVNESTVLVLTDTVYFKAQWRNVFGKYGPEQGEFARLDGTSVNTTFLVDLEQPGLRGTGDGYVGAELPYLGEDFAMLIVVPDEGRFDEVRQRLSADLLNEIDATFTTGPYELRMPEWETTSAINLLGWLTEQGIAPGEFPGIGPGVFLDGAVHGADITVDDVGTEAAAATALSFEESGPPDPELVVAADQPFFYVIRHVESGAVLFAGQVTDPTT